MCEGGRAPDHQDEAEILFQVLNVDIWSHLNK